MSQIRQNDPYKFRFHYQGFYIKEVCLGSGLYGEVYKADCDQLPCAAKILHNHPDRDTIINNFEQERALLSSIRHPYIVQFLDITLDPETKHPVLLMELLDESLTALLERSQPQPLAYNVQVDISHDMALAVSYLHSKNIIHRDLSSNNVLIIAGRRAKVTDFCMFGIDVSDTDNHAPIMTSITKQPNSDYMPPEALRKPPNHTKKLDCYSEGVIMMQICTLRPPEKAERLNHMELISSTHPFLPIINKCLNIEEKDRPSAADICDSLSKLKTATEYDANMHPAVLDTKETVLLSDSPQSSVVQKNEAPLEQPVEMQYPNNSISVNKESKYEQKPHSDSQLKAAEPRKWSSGMAISPREMVRGAVALSMNGDEAYFMNKSGEIWLYDSTDELQPWSKVNNSYRQSRQYSSLAIVNGLLTLIGGLADRGLANAISNTLLSLIGDDVDTKEWKEHFPPMPTARYFTAAVTTSQHLVVAGGIGIEKLSRFLPNQTKKVNLSCVEVMNTNTDTHTWSTVASLSHPYCKMSATICGDKLYLLGGVDPRAKTHSVLACSVAKLVESNKDSDGVWKQLRNDAPNYYCTGANLNGDLIVVGGEAQSGKETTVKNEVYKYDPDRGTWKLITNAPTARYNCLVATFPSKKMVVVVGGCEEKKLCTATEIWQY